MRATALIMVLLAGACKSHSATKHTSQAPKGPPPPVALVGDWVQFWPTARRGDTLTLRADWSASGRIPARDQAAMDMATRWQVQFRSHDPAVARRDGPGGQGGYTDGGDADCLVHPNASCTSLPMLCIGDAERLSCQAFRFSTDSLAFSTGEQYVRAHHAATGERPTPTSN